MAFNISQMRVRAVFGERHLLVRKSSESSHFGFLKLPENVGIIKVSRSTSTHHVFDIVASWSGILWLAMFVNHIFCDWNYRVWQELEDEGFLGFLVGAVK